MNNEKNNTLLCKLSRKLTKYWKTSYSSSIIYPNDKAKTESAIISAVKKIPASKYVFHPARVYLTKVIDNSYFTKKIVVFLQYLLSTSLRCYSIALASFFAISLLFDVLTNTFTEKGAIFSTVAIISLIPLFFSKKSISQMIYESGFLSYIFLDLLCFERLETYAKKEPRENVSVWLIIGFANSFLTLIYSRESILIFLALTIVAVLFMCRPEVSAMTISLVIAFAPMKIMIILSAVSIFSYIIKAIRGKRSFYFKKYDVFAVIIMFILCLINPKSVLWLKIIPFCSLYFVFSGMLRTKEMLIRCLKNLCASITILASYNLILFFLENEFKSISFYLSEGVRINTNFENSESLTALYGCAIIIGFSFILFGREKKGFYIFSSVINFVSLVFCGVSIAIPAVFLGCMFLCLCMYKNKIMIFFVATAFSAIVLKLSELFIGTYNGFYTSTKLFENYTKYALLGTENSQMIFNAEGIKNAGSLWAQLSFEGGIIIAIIVFVFSILFVRNCFSLKTSDLYEKTKFIRIAVSASIVSYLIISFGCFTWDNYKIFCLFWVLAGLSSTLRRYVLRNSEIHSAMFPDNYD